MIRKLKNNAIFSPICPDYHFRVVEKGEEKERIHDFDGMGKDVGIVYQKLIQESSRLFKKLGELGIKYKQILLVADVENYDPVILGKLNLSKDEFNRRCNQTVKKINQDLIKRGLKHSKCYLMSEFFTKEKYPFYRNIKLLNYILKKTQDKNIKKFIKKVQKIRLPLHQFWFNLAKEKSLDRSIEEIAMYDSFGFCPKINKGVILCADSEILSSCYNIFKKRKTPVLYITGGY